MPLRIAFAFALTLCLSSAATSAENEEPKSPASEWQAALTDARTLEPTTCKSTRYLTCFGLPEAEWDTMYKLFCARVVGMSRIPEPVLPKRVTPSLFSVNVELAGVDKYAYGRHYYSDPFLHVPVSKDGLNEYDRTDGHWYLGGVESVEELKRLTGSSVPLLFADWEWVRTSIQEGRGKPGEGDGYYDFIGVASRDDFFKAVGADRKAVERLAKEWRAVVEQSGVVRFPRQVFAEGIIGGHMWGTLDITKAPKGKSNPQRQLHKFEHEVEEYVAPGPAGLPWFLLNDKQGVIQNSAPDTTGFDKTRKGNNARIEINSACIRCHKQAFLQPVDDWVANTLQLPLFANLPHEEYNRVRQLFFRGAELQRKLAADRAGYEARILEVTGWPSGKYSAEYARMMDKLTESPLTIHDVARYAGVTAARLRTVLELHSQAATLDPGLAALLKPKGTINREMFEEMYLVVQAYLHPQLLEGQ